VLPAAPQRWPANVPALPEVVGQAVELRGVLRQAQAGQAERPGAGKDKATTEAQSHRRYEGELPQRSFAFAAAGTIIAFGPFPQRRTQHGCNAPVTGDSGWAVVVEAASCRLDPLLGEQGKRQDAASTPVTGALHIEGGT
jgi:hypothetical protein